MERNLKLLGYECIRPNLPLTFKEFEYSAIILEELFENLSRGSLGKDEKVHFVGHSTGGLVVRKFVSETKYTFKIGRCVLIATPNKGSKLANIATRFKPVGKIYRTLTSLNYEYIDQVHFRSDSNIEIAAIGGNKNKLLLGNLIGGINDGRVELSSVFYPELKDFITLPYAHNEIHHQRDTAKWVDSFLRTGSFKSQISQKANEQGINAY